MVLEGQAELAGKAGLLEVGADRGQARYRGLDVVDVDCPHQLQVWVEDERDMLVAPKEDGAPSAGRAGEPDQAGLVGKPNPVGVDRDLRGREDEGLALDGTHQA